MIAITFNTRRRHEKIFDLGVLDELLYGRRRTDAERQAEANRRHEVVMTALDRLGRLLFAFYWRGETSETSERVRAVEELFTELGGELVTVEARPSP